MPVPFEKWQLLLTCVWVKVGPYGHGMCQGHGVPRILIRTDRLISTATMDATSLDAGNTSLPHQREPAPTTHERHISYSTY